MPSAGSIFVDLLLNDARFVDGLKRSQKGLLSFGNIAKTVFSAKIINEGINIAVESLKGLTTEAFRTIDATSKMARSLGIANDKFQALSLVADEAGVAQDQFTNLIGKAQKAIVEGARGSKQYADAFKSLQLNVKSLIDLSPDQEFLTIADALQRVENPTIRNALAMQIFGKTGRDVSNMLEDLRGKTQDADDFLKRFNVSVSDVDARKIEEANDAFGRLKTAASGIGTTIAIQLSPLITEVSNQLLNAGIDGEDFGRAIRRGIDWAASGMDLIRQSIIGTAAITLELSRDIDLFVLDASKNFYDLAKATREFFLPFQKGQGRAEQFFSQANKNAQNSAKIHIAALNELQQEASKYKSTLESVNRIQLQADERARKSVANGKVNNPLVPEITIDEGVKKASEGFDKITDRANQWASDMNYISARASQSIEQSLEDFLFDPADKGFKGMLKGFVDSLRRMQAEAAASKIVKSLFGSNFGSSDSGGIIGSLFSGNSLSQSIGFATHPGQFGPFPGFASGIDTVPYDMAAVIHKDEAVLNRADAQAWRSGKSGNNYTFNVGEFATQRDIMRLQSMIITAAGPGVIERRVTSAQNRGEI